MKKTTLFFLAAFAATMCFTESIKAGNDASSYKYMIIDLYNGKIKYINFEPRGGWSDTYKTTKLVMRRIEPGTFTMGSPASELGRFDNEPQHSVSISAPFYIGIFEITQSQYSLITGQNPSQFKGSTRPVENVSYNDVYSSFFYNMREKLGLDFELPTEAQWEYACRAGTTTAWNNGSDITDPLKDKELDKLGRYQQNTNDSKGGYTEHTAVGSYLSNEWGIYDMHGNVWEWCLDWYSDLNSNFSTDPKGANLGSFRVLRGGSWHAGAKSCRSAVRNRYYPDSADSNFGFRIVSVPQKKEQLSDDWWPSVIIRDPKTNDFNRKNPTNQVIRSKNKRKQNPSDPDINIKIIDSITELIKSITICIWGPADKDTSNNKGTSKNLLLERIKELINDIIARIKRLLSLFKEFALKFLMALFVLFIGLGIIYIFSHNSEYKILFLPLVIIFIYCFIQYILSEFKLLEF